MTTNNCVARLRSELNKLKAYVVPDASGLVKLDAMENPFPWPEHLRAQWLDVLSQVSVNRYPQPDPVELKQKLQQRFGPKEEVGCILGNGSDELIQLLTLAIAQPDASVLTVSPSFSMYQMIADMVGTACNIVPLQKNFELDMSAMLNAIEQHDPAVTFIAYPNNPTGNLWPKEEIRQIANASKGLVVIDEAYGPFANETFADEIAEHKNMLLLRTASKLGLAGIRFGWLIGDVEFISELNKLRLPYNINQLTQLTMDMVLDNYEVFAQQAKQICQLRNSLYQDLVALDGVQPYPSAANFILFKVLSRDADDVFQELLDQDVLVKNLSQQTDLNQCLRVTIGTERENKLFYNALRQALIS